MQQKVVVYISQEGEGELEDLHDLLSGAVAEVNWVGSINGQEVPVSLRLGDAADPGE